MLIILVVVSASLLGLFLLIMLFSMLTMAQRADAGAEKIITEEWRNISSGISPPGSEERKSSVLKDKDPRFDGYKGERPKILSSI